ncbi:MAG: hypothetical protein IJ446_05815 [Oscillospiraceae bacterium]|nr:hypothetical protein [Oscillospiraceae bacterium]
MCFAWQFFAFCAASYSIFAAYPVEKNMPLNFLQEVIATFVFLFLVFIGIAGVTATTADNQSLVIGAVGFAAVAFMALTFNSTGFSMNAMRSVFSSIWFTILPIPNKGEKVDWGYQIIVNFIGSSIGGILAVIATSVVKSML